jgi:hypothetical protein
MAGMMVEMMVALMVVMTDFVMAVLLAELTAVESVD